MKSKYNKSQYVSAKPMGHFMPKLMKPAFEKYGFPAAALLTDWAQIIGPELALFTEPEQLKWPKGGAHSQQKNRGATLILRVDGPAALEVQHSTPQIIERINGYFGYQAVAHLRILQAPVHKKAPSAVKMPADLDQKPHGIPTIDPNKTDPLSTALKRMWNGIQHRQKYNKSTTTSK